MTFWRSAAKTGLVLLLFELKSAWYICLAARYFLLWEIHFEKKVHGVLHSHFTMNVNLVACLTTLLSKLCGGYVQISERR